MKVKAGTVSKEYIVTRLERAGMNRALARKVVDAAAELLPSATAIDGGAEPLALFLFGVAAGFAQSSAKFAEASSELDVTEECSGAKAEALKGAAMLLNAAAMMAASLAESVGPGEPEVPQA